MRKNTYRQDDIMAGLTEKIHPMGKMPPQAIELEETVLGALMLERDAILIVSQILLPTDFYKTEHQLIYEAIYTLFSKAKPIDIRTVTQQLRIMGKLEEVGGAYSITELTNRVGSAANIEYHAEIILGQALKREVITLFYKLENDAYAEETDPHELLLFAQSELLRITNRNSKSKRRSIGEIASEVVADTERMAKLPPEKAVTGTPTGLDDLDHLLGGLESGDLLILAARPGMGKTSLALCVSKAVALKGGKPVAFFSLEVSDKRLVRSLLSIISGIPNDQLKNGRLDTNEWTELVNAQTKLENSKLIIDDAPGLSYVELRSRCLALKAQHPDLGLIVVDYLQLMSGVGKKERVHEISDISRNLKLIAKETEVPVIALSQLSRQVEQRGGAKRPILSDLRESGSIEQDADQVVFVFRPEYYGVNEDSNGKPTKGIAELIVAKNRHGATDTVVVMFDGPTTTFRDLNYRESLEPKAPF